MKNLIFKSEIQPTVSLEVKAEKETVWVTKNQLSDLFQCDERTLRNHIHSVLQEVEVDKRGWKNISIPTKGGVQQVKHYNLDVIIGLGFVINSQVAKEFRKFARKHLNELLTTGKTAVAPKKTDAQLTSSFKAMLGLAKVMGLEGNQAILKANKAVKKLYDRDCLALMEVELHNEKQEQLLTPTEIGKRLNTSAIKVNRILEKAGLQVKQLSNKSHQWVLTDNGKQYAVILDTGKSRSDGTPVQQIKWYTSVLDLLRTA